jgi:hypothetical protein
VFALPLIPPVRSKAFEPRAWGSGHPSDRTVRHPSSNAQTNLASGRNLENIAVGELARWIKATTSHDRTASSTWSGMLHNSRGRDAALRNGRLPEENIIFANANSGFLS